MIDVCAFSDGHGIFPKIEKPFDLCLIGGDNIHLHFQREKRDAIDWYYFTFSEWINELPFKDSESRVLWIAGNHEIGLEKLGQEGRQCIAKDVEELTNGKAIYLEDSLYRFKNLVIYGTPWCKIFGNWAFNKDNDSLKRTYEAIPYNIDILLTHDAPYGTSDICFDWTKWGRTPYSIGNEPLRDVIVEKKPKINIHGHLHSSNHNVERLNETDVYCVSILDEEYKNTYEPLYLEL